MVKYRKIPEERRHTIMDKEVLNYVVEKKQTN